MKKKKKKNVLKVAKKIDGKFPAERRLSTRPALCFPPKQQELVGQKNITEKKDLTEVTRFFLAKKTFASPFLRSEAVVGRGRPPTLRSSLQRFQPITA